MNKPQDDLQKLLDNLPENVGIVKEPEPEPEPVRQYTPYPFGDADIHEIDESEPPTFIEDEPETERESTRHSEHRHASRHERSGSKESDKKSNSEKPKKGSKTARVLSCILYVVLALLIAVSAVIAVLYYVGRSSLLGNEGAIKIPSGVFSKYNGKRVEYNSKAYVYDEDVTSILCIGVDKIHSGADDMMDKVVGENGQADALYLLAIDTAENKYDVIGISRDSITDIDTYTPSGNLIGSVKTQLCLSYAYGTSKEEAASCENTLKAVSRMFYNIPINTYFAINRDAISVLNDAVGGVSVSEFDNSGNKTGAIKTLTGAEALEYLRFRDTTVLDSNNVRMLRQQEYIKAFSDKCIEATKANLGTPLDLYNIMSDYSVTNLTAPKITYLTTNAFKNSNVKLDYRKVEGEVVAGKDGYAEFNIDEDKLLELVLEVFYDEDSSTVVQTTTAESTKD